MKLTNYLRDAFLKAAMDDVPKTDYQELIRAEVKKIHQVLLKKAGIEAVDFARLDRNSVYINGTSYAIPGIFRSEEKMFATPAIDALAKAAKEQSTARNTLEEKLRGIAYGCTTRKQLVELLPEFEKYLPAEQAKTSNLPAISNVVGDFIRAGWPKDKQVAAA